MKKGKMNPKLSIITINYNNKAGLEKTIQSVSEQTSGDFEYIVIDGGSDDGSVEIIRDNKDKISRWVSEPDNGIYHAMNKGIQAAKGEYCQFLNSGDWLVDGRVIETMLARISDCGIIYGNMLKQMPDGTRLKDKGAKGEVSMFTFYRGTLNHSSAFIKRSLFDLYGLYDENLQIVSDWKWYLQVVGLHNEPVCYTDVDVTCFDMTGISSRGSDLEKIERRQVLEELLPPNILKDYDRHWFSIVQMERLKRFRLMYRLVWLMERILYKVEKMVINK